MKVVTRWVGLLFFLIWIWAGYLTGAPILLLIAGIIGSFVIWADI